MMGIGRPSKTFLAAACLAASAEVTSATAGGGLSSSDLLQEGFKLIAEGDLLTVREIGGYRLLDAGIFVDGPPSESCQRNDTFVAEVPSQPRPRCGSIWWNDRYDEFVRLKRGNEEFVCVLGQSEDCYRAYRSAQ
ncbi:hypothetical protein [Mesorhizobium sp.]|uniref:hypothetical protein n=1 Tax=Mesorhizobium sp. TaxID=1871066 RepID=UPI003BACE158